MTLTRLGYIIIRTTTFPSSFTTKCLKPAVIKKKILGGILEYRVTFNVSKIAGVSKSRKDCVAYLPAVAM